MYVGSSFVQFILLFNVMNVLIRANQIEQPRANQRLLAVINMYSLMNWELLEEVVDGYLNICEGGWHVKIVFLVAFDWTDDLSRYLNRNLYCYRLGQSIPIEVRVFNKSIGVRIVNFSRRPVSEYINDFDVFLYTEDDMVP